MASERDEEVGTTENQEEVMDLCITITEENIRILLELYKHNHHNAGMDAILHMIRDTIIEKVKERFNVDLS